MTLPRRLPGRRPGWRARNGLAVLLLAAVLPVLTPAPAGAAEAGTASPLTVHLTRLAPATLPKRGQVVLAGTVTNSSDESWGAVNVYPFISRTPLRSREELATAADSEEDAEVGTRITDVGRFAALGDLEPGDSLPFRIALPAKFLRGQISGESGVYWIGVHALGQNADGRDGLADGRARTFIPLVPDGPRTTAVSLVVPVRAQVRRDREGRVLGSTAWSASLSPNGRLGRLAGFLSSAGSRAATLLVDPAVLDAVEDLKDENPALSFGEAPDGDDEATPTPSPTDQASRSVARMDPADRATAAAWLDAVTASARTHTVLGLGYGDPDVSALARRRPAMLGLANRLALQTFSGLEVAAVPTVAPPDGWLDDDALEAVAPESMVLVSDHSAPRTRTQWRTTSDQDLVFADAQAASGGPGPTEPQDALALRQRILADAALRLASGAASPMVVELPADWDPGEGWQLADFFNALDTPWLDLVPLSGSTDSATPTFDAALGYPSSQRREEIATPNVAAARALVQTTTLLTRLLRTENTLAHDLAGDALTAVSYQARDDQDTARYAVGAANEAVRGRLGKVQVIGTDFVTLSGGSGTLAVTLVNGMDQPITVGVHPRITGNDVTIEKTDPLDLAPGQRAVLRLKAEAAQIGVTQVVLTPVTADGRTFGSPLTFSLRTSQVGKAVWVILSVGGVLLVLLVARRIRRGLREHRWRETA